MPFHPVMKVGKLARFIGESPVTTQGIMCSWMQLKLSPTKNPVLGYPDMDGMSMDSNV